MQETPGKTAARKTAPSKVAAKKTPAKAAAGAPAPVRKAATGKVVPESTAKSTLRPAPTQDQIALRAYHIWAERGFSHGDPNRDWAHAERELKQA